MYKVFVNEKVICFTNNAEIVKEFSDVLVLHFFQVELTPFLVEVLDESSKTKAVLVLIEDYKVAFAEFKKHFTLITAAGGLVKNKEEKKLFIYRLNKWGLPKGKLEKNETIEAAAIREVEEECGIDSLKIIEKLPDTYHIYLHKEKLILKQTVWYEMTTDFEGELVPQAEEDITKVEWLNDKEIKEKVLSNTYSSLKGLIANSI